MNKEFIPYEQALELKKLGFDKDGFGLYNENGDLILNNDNISFLEWYKNKTNADIILAPLYQQAFKFFRKKYKLEGTIQLNYWSILGGIWDLNGYKDSRYDWESEQFPSYEKAQIDCLNTLIKIVKDNTK